MKSLFKILLLTIAIIVLGVQLAVLSFPPAPSKALILSLQSPITSPDCHSAAGSKVSIASRPRDPTLNPPECNVLEDLITESGGRPDVDIIFVCGNGPGNLGSHDLKFVLSYPKDRYPLVFGQVLNMTASGIQKIPARLTVRKKKGIVPVFSYVDVDLLVRVDAKKKSASYEYLVCG